MQDRLTNAATPSQRPCERQIDQLPVGCQLVPIGAVNEYLESSSRHPLAVIVYGGAKTLSGSTRCPVVEVALEPLGPVPCAEIWTARQPAVFRSDPGVLAAQSGEILFGVVHWEWGGAGSIEEQTRQAYQTLFAFLEQVPQSNLVRVWNYFPGMHEESAGLDRYQRFCIGRAAAIEAQRVWTVRDLPAATAIGSRTGGLVVLFLAAVKPGIQLANPRQVEPYLYPQDYGPKSPAFARATLMACGRVSQLFISGTASILGHASVHPGQPEAQMHEALRNVTELLRRAHKLTGGRIGGTEELNLVKIYLRDPALYPLIQEQWESTVGTGVPAFFLAGEICRAELLLELEAIALAC